MNRRPDQQCVDPEDPFLERLVADLAPVTACRPTARALAAWTLPSAVAVIAGVLLTGPLRSSVPADLSSLHTVLETLLGGSAAVALAWVGLEIDVPGGVPARRMLAPAVAMAMAMLWIALVLGGPALDTPLGLAGPGPSMAGKRPHCFLEGLLISTLPAALALVSLRRRTISPGWRGGALLGLAGGGLTATAMQLACMDAPAHALHYHLTPPLLVGLASGLIARFALPRD